MSIIKFKFLDNARAWTLEETSFANFNLLVGLSGVGKTRILDSLRAVRHAGIFDTRYVNGCQWRLEFASEGMTFLWTAETSHLPSRAHRLFLAPDEERSNGTHPYFIRECIVRDDGEVLVERSADEFRFGSTLLPKLKNTESAITLLRDEATIAPLNRALRQMIFSPFADANLVALHDPSELINLPQQYQDLHTLREDTTIPILLKSYILQEQHPAEFERIKSDYSAIFDTVVDIKLAQLSEFEPKAKPNGSSATDWLTVGIQELGVKGWISLDLSSGMRRTFIHLMELAMAPRGSLIVIDDLENSLGVNCLDEIVARMLARANELQFLLTSHHPYVINNIPSKYWKIVTRNGSTVTVLDEATIPALQTASRHEKFLLLMNLPQYEEGIQ